MKAGNIESNLRSCLFSGTVYVSWL